MPLLRKNFSEGLLKTDISDVDTQMTVKAHNLPTTAGQFRLVIWNDQSFPNPADDPNVEIITAKYSGTPNVYDIVRGQENTAAVSHSANSRVALHLTAGMSEDDINWVGSKEVDESAVGDGKVLVVSGDKLIYKKLLGYDSDLATLVTDL